MLAAMTATSFDRTAAWLGRRAWRVLHLVGSFYLWGAFVQAFFRRALHAPGYGLPLALAVAAMLLRVVAWYRGRTKSRRATPSLLGAYVVIESRREQVQKRCHDVDDQAGERHE